MWKHKENKSKACGGLVLIRAFSEGALSIDKYGNPMDSGPSWLYECQSCGGVFDKKELYTDCYWEGREDE